MPKRKNENLGQVFTSTKVAKYMVQLLLANCHGAESILDPCIGKNIFFETIRKTYPQNKFSLTGLEVDKSLIDSDFYDDSSNSLIMGNFFDLSTNHKYNLIIANPPYVRHEQLKSDTINSKKEIRAKFGKELEHIDTKSNLYIYFIAKLLKHLKDEGKMVVIIYDSWQYTQYGQKFFKYINENFSLDKIIHIEEPVFDGINVSCTILEIHNSEQKTAPMRIRVKNADQLASSQEPSYSRASVQHCLKLQKSFLNTHFFENLADKYKHRRRGIETLSNQHFYVDELRSDDTELVMKSIKKLDQLIVKKEALDRLLLVKQDKSIDMFDKDTRLYLNSIKASVLNSNQGYITLRKRIKNKPTSWYVTNTIKPGNILFNYYIRNNYGFIYNPKNYFASNNFYIIDSDSPLLDIAILNSDLTKLSIMLTSRNQGNGLKKLQLYEFDKIRIPKNDIFSPSQKQKLVNIAKDLVECPKSKTEKFTTHINKILIEELRKSGCDIDEERLYHSINVLSS